MEEVSKYEKVYLRGTTYICHGTLRESVGGAVGDGGVDGSGVAGPAWGCRRSGDEGEKAVDELHVDGGGFFFL